ncbi:hypothetical protein [Virgisporangium aurantiacum]|uniref:Uncharacterized protein n=1 Tax=Virgisporangium aurantiacum TaxID=175570 RepID=A0A8J3ZN72_9ACTN|nr:hypothetical protein [Virgisporangium aurantiacum]GIJ64626.1 hypothetical protein Vau01_121420 [Virgisporangium aurantiacum]
MTVMPAGRGSAGTTPPSTAAIDATIGRPGPKPVPELYDQHLVHPHHGHDPGPAHRRGARCDTRDLEAQIRAAYADLAAWPDAVVPLTELRAALPPDLDVPARCRFRSGS